MMSLKVWSQLTRLLGTSSTTSRMPSLSSSMSCSSLILSPSVSSASRKSLSILSGTALLPSVVKSPSVSAIAIDVASRFSSLTSKPSLVSLPSNSSNKPSPSASVVALEIMPVCAVVAPGVPRSAVSSTPSLSLSRSRKSAIRSLSVSTGVRPVPTCVYEPSAFCPNPTWESS